MKNVFPTRVQLIALASEGSGDWHGTISLRNLEETLFEFLKSNQEFMAERLSPDPDVSDFIPESLKAFFAIALAENEKNK